MFNCFKIFAHATSHNLPTVHLPSSLICRNTENAVQSFDRLASLAKTVGAREFWPATIGSAVVPKICAN